jgi:hypothetical protein
MKHITLFHRKLSLIERFERVELTGLATTS